MLVLTLGLAESTFLDLPNGLGTIEVKIMPRVPGKSKDRIRVGFAAPKTVGVRRADAKSTEVRQRSTGCGGPDYSHGPRAEADPSTPIPAA